ncbi:MAG: uroporphyrinogen-III synthase [Rhodothermales bacterium]
MSKTSPLVYLFRTPAEPDPYEKALAAAGFRCRSVPVLDFEFTGREALQEKLAHPDRYGGLLLTSPRAVEALAEALLWLPNQVAAWTAKPVFAVGPRTSEVLRQLGLQPQGEQAGNAEALADVLEQTATKLDGMLLFLCGDRRREILPERLRRADVAFEECTVYRTLAQAELALPDEEPDWIVFFSPSGVEAVQRTSEMKTWKARIAAIGPTTAAALRQAGRAVDVTAQEPSPEALVQALAAHRKEKTTRTERG